MKTDQCNRYTPVHKVQEHFCPQVQEKFDGTPYLEILQSEKDTRSRKNKLNMKVLQSIVRLNGIKSKDDNLLIVGH